MIKLTTLSLLLSCALLQLACVSPVKEPIPPLRMQAQGNHQKALKAIRRGDLQEGALSWQSAVRQYQALDDWSGQGAARLGLAQVQQKLAMHQEAKATLMPLLELGDQFAAEQVAQAWLQLAQIQLAQGDAVAATQALSESQRQCTSPCSLRWVQQNVAAQLAAQQQDWLRVASLSAELIAQAAQTERAEISHAYRLQAQAQLALQQNQAALKSIDLALELNRQLARPEWLLADYRLRLQIVGAIGDEAQIKLTEQKIASLCAALLCNAQDNAGVKHDLN